MARWPASTEVQTLLLPRSQFTPVQAKAWAKRHKFKAEKVDVPERGAFVRVRQHPPGYFHEDTFRTIEFGEGIKAVVGVPKHSWKRAERVERMACSTKIDQPEYQFYVVLRDGKIESGWEYREDAQDHARELREAGYTALVRTRRALVSADRDPRDNWSWATGGLDTPRSERMTAGQAWPRRSIVEKSEADVLTFDEFLDLMRSAPALVPSFPADQFMRLASKPKVRLVLESQLPDFSAAVIANAEQLRAKGLAVPARFLPTAPAEEGRKPACDELLPLLTDLWKRYEREKTT